MNTLKLIKNSDNSKQSGNYNELINNELNYNYPLGFLALNDLQGMSLNGREELQYFIDNFPEIAEREKENLLLHLRGMSQGKYDMNIIGQDTFVLGGYYRDTQLFKRAKELGLEVHSIRKNVWKLVIIDDTNTKRTITFAFSRFKNIGYCKITVHAGKFLTGIDHHLATGHEMHLVKQFIAKLLKINLSERIETKKRGENGYYIEGNSIWNYCRNDITGNFYHILDTYTLHEIVKNFQAPKGWNSKPVPYKNGYYFHKNKEWGKSQQVILIYEKLNIETNQKILRIESRNIGKSKAVNSTPYSRLFDFKPEADSSSRMTTYNELVTSYIQKIFELINVCELKDKRNCKSKKIRQMLLAELYEVATATKTIQSMHRWGNHNINARLALENILFKKPKNQPLNHLNIQKEELEKLINIPKYKSQTPMKKNSFALVYSSSLGQRKRIIK